MAACSVYIPLYSLRLHTAIPPDCVPQRPPASRHTSKTVLTKSNKTRQKDSFSSTNAVDIVNWPTNCHTLSREFCNAAYVSRNKKISDQCTAFVPAIDAGGRPVCGGASVRASGSRRRCFGGAGAGRGGGDGLTRRGAQHFPEPVADRRGGCQGAGRDRQAKPARCAGHPVSLV